MYMWSYSIWIICYLSSLETALYAIVCGLCFGIILYTLFTIHYFFVFLHQNQTAYGF